MIMISNCDITEIFRATGITVDTTNGQTTIAHGTAANSQASFNTTYTVVGAQNAIPVRVMRFEANAYFVGDSGRTTPDGQTIFSLFVLDTTQNPIGDPTELVEGVENLQVLYGENTQPNPDAPPQIRYVTATNVGNPANILSVQLGLLIATADYSASSADTGIYHIAGTTVGPPGSATNAQHPGDRRLRAAYNATIQLRNRTQ